MHRWPRLTGLLWVPCLVFSTSVRPVVAGETVGPDVIVHSISGTGNYGSELDPMSGGRIHAFSIGTTSCNIGDEPAIWFDHNNQHPVIAQNMYRLKDGRFEQIGMSWLKHGFFAVAGTSCGTCTAPVPTDGNYLYVGCSDPYSASLNGSQSNLGPRSPVNAFTGFFPFPFNRNHLPNRIDRRLQVRDADLDTALNAGASYFVEGQYVTPDEAAAGNHFNNASYRRVTVSRPVPGQSPCAALSPILDWCMVGGAPTQPEKAAIRAWRDNDNTVVETDVLVPGEGLFILASKTTGLQDGFWRYEYALQNLNSHRSGGSLRVPLPPGAMVRNVGFHAPFYHSGEPYDGADWTPLVADDHLTWSTTPFTVNQNANALRWSTLYNFRFECDVAPQTTSVTIGLFRPGTPSHVTATTIGPAVECIDAPSMCDDGMDCTVDECVEGPTAQELAAFEACCCMPDEPASAMCLVYDSDDDGDVDADDRSYFLASQFHCVHTIMPGFCLINGVCVAEGERNPLQPCEDCDSEMDPAGWTRLPAGSSCEPLFGGECLLNGVCDESGNCSVEPHDELCDDGQFCNGEEVCDPVDGCQPAPFLCNAGAYAGLACEVVEECWDSPCLQVCSSGPGQGLPCAGSQDCLGAPCTGTCQGGATPGLACTTVDQCNTTRRCIRGPDCNDDIPCTTDSCDEDNDRCLYAPNHSACSDGLYCNGVERCSADLGCRPGISPCSPATCNEATDTCRGFPALRGPSTHPK